MSKLTYLISTYEIKKYFKRTQEKEKRGKKMSSKFMASFSNVERGLFTECNK